MVRCQVGAKDKFEGKMGKKVQNASTQTSPGKIGEIAGLTDRSLPPPAGYIAGSPSAA